MKRSPITKNKSLPDLGRLYADLFKDKPNPLTWVAAYLGVAENTVRTWLSYNEMPVLKAVRLGLLCDVDPAIFRPDKIEASRKSA